jgi:hypothetical protein
MRKIRPNFLLVTVAGAHALAVTAASAQALVCCSQSIQVDGSWIGSSRISDCQTYFDGAPPEILRRMCQQRPSLKCIDTRRCDTLPPEERTPDPTSGDPASPNPDRDGLADGFGGPPPSPSAPPKGQVSPPRLVYLIMGVPGADKPATSFMVWLDQKGCPLALDQNNRLADSAAAKHVVRGKVIHRDGRVRIEAEAQQRPGGAKLGPFTAESEGEDAAAVARATHAAMEKMKLVCAR